MDEPTTSTHKKRLGRPRKDSIIVIQQPPQRRSPIATVIVDDDSNEMGDEDLGDAECTSLALSPTPNRRRSSRKKIIKFDVRDLLNKNRKAHKIQIEARIDSNAPTTPSVTLPHNTKAIPASADNRLDKSSLFRYSTSDARTVRLQAVSPKCAALDKTDHDFKQFKFPSQPRPLSRTQDLFIKQKQPVKSLIVEQIDITAETGSACVKIEKTQKQQSHGTIIQNIAPIYNEKLVIESEALYSEQPRKRGRPRKIKPCVQQLSHESIEQLPKIGMDTPEQEQKIEKLPTSQCEVSEEDVYEICMSPNNENLQSFKSTTSSSETDSVVDLEQNELAYSTILPNSISQNEDTALQLRIASLSEFESLDAVRSTTNKNVTLRVALRRINVLPGDVVTSNASEESSEVVASCTDEMVDQDSKTKEEEDDEDAEVTDDITKLPIEIQSILNECIRDERQDQDQEVFIENSNVDVNDSECNDSDDECIAATCDETSLEVNFEIQNITVEAEPTGGILKVEESTVQNINIDHSTDSNKMSEKCNNQNDIEIKKEYVLSTETIGRVLVAEQSDIEKTNIRTDEGTNILSTQNDVVKKQFADVGVEFEKDEQQLAKELTSSQFFEVLQKDIDKTKKQEMKVETQELKKSETLQVVTQTKTLQKNETEILENFENIKVTSAEKTLQKNETETVENFENIKVTSAEKTLQKNETEVVENFESIKVTSTEKEKFKVGKSFEAELKTDEKEKSNNIVSSSPAEVPNTKYLMENISVEMQTLRNILQTVESNKESISSETLNDAPIVTADANDQVVKDEVIIEENIDVQSHNRKDLSIERLNTASPLEVRRTPVRRSRRSSLLGVTCNKTLEETFAEIAQKSSREILSMTAGAEDEASRTSSSSTPITDSLTEDSSMECSKIETLPNMENSCPSPSTSSSPFRTAPSSSTESTAVPTVKSKRGRKPKSANKYTPVCENIIDPNISSTQYNQTKNRSEPSSPIRKRHNSVCSPTVKSHRSLGRSTSICISTDNIDSCATEENPTDINITIENEMMVDKNEDIKILDISNETLNTPVAAVNESLIAECTADKCEFEKSVEESEIGSPNIARDERNDSVEVSVEQRITLTEKIENRTVLSPTPTITIANIEMEVAEIEEALDPLKDIEKFIEAGVNLLKKDYKIDEDSVDTTTITPIATSTRSSPTLDLLCDDDFSKHAHCFETPSYTPLVTPTATPPPMRSTTPLASLDESSVSMDMLESANSSGVRRSHRIKQITQIPKARVGRGVVRDKERFSSKEDGETKTHYSLDDHLMDLAEVEAKNAKFLKEMEERLSNFSVIRENVYKCDRIVSKEARKMICDCFLTTDEEKRGEMGCGEDCLNRLLMIECGAYCNNKERCTNKRFQKKLCSPCRVFRTAKKGFGIMADIEILPGEFIMEYVGEVIDGDEFEHRQHIYSKDKNRHYYFMALRSDCIIDATTKGNISRFINHSCDPNAETQKWTVNGELRIGFFSRKSIMPGEEITFDYQYQRYGRDAQRCFCESANCRGWIGQEPASDEGEQVDDVDSDGEGEHAEEDYSIHGYADDESETDEFGNKIESKGKKSSFYKSNEPPSKKKRAGGVVCDDDDSKSKFSKILNKMVMKKPKQQQKDKKERKRRSKLISGKENDNKSRSLEDPDIEDEVNILNRSGLKNQSDTLRLSRLMVRAKLVETRLKLLGILRQGEVPCRRLFLDYHGLRLLHGWMSEAGNDLNVRMALLETLQTLPIPNKTVLTDSKVYQLVKNWSGYLPLSTTTSTTVTGENLSPSDESSKESSTSSNSNSMQLTQHEQTIQMQDIPKDLQLLANNLTSKWNSLPEIFRIPKRERIEQMKEHEREADRHAAAESVEDNSDRTPLSTDRYKRDRFGRSTSSRYSKPSATGPSSSSSTATNNNTSNHSVGSVKETVRHTGVNAAGASGNGNYKTEHRRRAEIPLHTGTYERTKHLSKELRREMFAKKVARDEAEKRLSEERRVLDSKCRFFGFDPKKFNSRDMPFCLNVDTGQWFTAEGRLAPAPPNHLNVQVPPRAQSTDPINYQLPAVVATLPPQWKFAISPQGKIYYYHIEQRIPQWEPPTYKQLYESKLIKNIASESDNETDKKIDIDIDIEHIISLTDHELKLYIQDKVNHRRQQRYKRLVVQRSISPRREEDRIYNQIETRKYKENKEKIRRRKEEYRRRRSVDTSLKHSTNNTFASLPTSNSLHKPMPSLPIQDYLLSSDEEQIIKDECNNSPLIDKIVQGDKIVDELDALSTKRSLKRPLQIQQCEQFEIDSQPSTSSSAATAAAAAVVTPSFADERYDYKKRRVDRDKQRDDKKVKKSREYEVKYRKVKEKFRCDIAGLIVENLKPFRKDTCQMGRITNNQDFNHLARKLTHFVLVKELKYCESVGQTLVVTESVKNKSRDFIKKYMSKYGRVYIKPSNDPEFKDIPFNILN